MLPTIVQHPETLVTFISLLNLALYQPQIRHLLQIVDALLVSNERKTLSDLSRLFKEMPDAKNLADFFRESPWTVDLIGKPRKKFMLQAALDLARKAGFPLEVVVGIDDSLGKKGKATKHLQAVDYHHNHNESTKNRQAWNNGYVYVEAHVQIGPFSFLFDTQIYLREKKVRHLNRKRSKDKRVKYRSKYNLANAMLTELADLLPEDCKVYVLFDSWYASAKLINFCLRHKRWQVICALKSNRRLGKVRVDVHNQTLKHKPYQMVKLAVVDEQTPARTYHVRTVHGQIEDVAQEGVGLEGHAALHRREAVAQGDIHGEDITFGLPGVVGHVETGNPLTAQAAADEVRANHLLGLEGEVDLGVGVLAGVAAHVLPGRGDKQ